MNRYGRLPDEEEQFHAYREVVLAMNGRPVTIRTLDVGADKPLDSGDAPYAANPALGLRAIRYCLTEPKMFLEQLRAILRASAYGLIRLLIPMVTHIHEVEQALVLIEQAKAQLRERKVAFDEAISVGGMIEIPAAALTLPILAKRLDFFSIGTNDLIQYTLAIDRTDNTVAHLYDPLHPAILHLIAQTIQTCARYGREVSVCGEMAGDATFARLLLGMGLRQFSMHPAQMLSVKQEILRSDIGQCAALTKRILAATEPEKIRTLIGKLRGG
jgi:phosphotransferase system enzyme I (PtsI)